MYLLLIESLVVPLGGNMSFLYHEVFKDTIIAFSIFILSFLMCVDCVVYKTQVCAEDRSTKVIFKGCF